MRGSTPSKCLCYFFLSLLYFAMAGCATAPTPETGGDPNLALQQRLSTLQHWTVVGKLAVRTSDNAESAHLQWQQRAEQFDIRLAGPAGLKATRIYGTPADAHFEQGERHVQADSVEALSEQLIGWPLPARELTWWLRGLPAPNSRVQTASYAPAGWLAHLVQNGWRIDFSEPQQPTPQITLPSRIEAVRGDMRITLIIKTWQLD